MSQSTKTLAIGNLILVVSVLTIQLYELGMIGNLRELGHDREGVALGALLAGLPIAIFTGGRKIAPRLEGLA